MCERPVAGGADLTRGRQVWDPWIQGCGVNTSNLVHDGEESITGETSTNEGDRGGERSENGKT